MKKSIIALMGLFTLIACSEDAYQDADKASENSNVVAPPTIDTAIGYESPYELPLGAFRHRLNNSTGYDLTVTAYIGLAFYDGDPNSSSYTLLGETINLNDGNYPNIYSGRLKYGNVIEALPITVNPHEILISTDGSVPVFPSGNPSEFYFSFGPSVTPEEKELLNRFGKVYYVKYDVVKGTSLSTGMLSSGFVPDIGPFPTGFLPTNWQYINDEINYNRPLIHEVSSNEIVVTENTSINDFPSQANVLGENLRFQSHISVVEIIFD